MSQLDIFDKSEQLKLDLIEYPKKEKQIKSTKQEIIQLRHHGDNCKCSECKELGVGSYWNL